MIKEFALAEMPASLRHMPEPPKQLFIRTAQPGAFEDLMRRPRVAIVGSRKVTAYGQMVTEKFATELAAQGIVIVSGLAIGVDGIAHRAALAAGGLTMAVLPSSVESVYPRSHAGLADRILQKHGALISEYPPGTPGLKHHFVERNRIVAGLSNLLLIAEAAERSGTLHTANFAMEQGIDVLVVPGSILSPTSVGTNNLLKTGATPVTCSNDVLHALDMPAALDDEKTLRVQGANADEQCLIDLLEQGVQQGSELLERSGLSIDHFNHHLTMLEITAKIRPLGANQWSLR